MIQVSNKPGTGENSVRFALIMMGLAFAALMGATWYTVKIAMIGHEPVMDKHYYEKGLNYEKEIAEGIQMRSEGYHFDSSILNANSNLVKGTNPVEIRILKKDFPVNNAKLFLVRERSATNKFTEKTEVILEKDGIYRANIDFPFDGSWQITLNANVEGRSFDKTFMVIVK
mgnify:CR=1 FL=1